jgi:subtilisin family serine protease
MRRRGRGGANRLRSAAVLLAACCAFFAPTSALKHEHFRMGLRSALDQEMGFDDEATLRMALDFELAGLEKRGGHVHALACGPPQSDAMRALEEAVGGRHLVQPLYIHADDLACHRVRASLPTFTLIREAGFDVDPLPLSGKLSPSLSSFSAQLRGEFLDLLASGAVDAIEVHLGPSSAPWTALEMKNMLWQWADTLSDSEATWGHLSSWHFWAAQEEQEGGSRQSLLQKAGGHWRALSQVHDRHDCDWEKSVFEPADLSVRGHRLTLPAVRNGEGSCMALLLGFLASQPEVAYIEPKGKIVLHNMNANWVSQSGVGGFTPAWNIGLHGEDEVIGVADTGIDLGHCSFRDEDGYRVAPSDPSNPITDMSRRKVVQYIAYADTLDETDGHGTHVAGIVAGMPVGLPSGQEDFRGMAYEAKLAFFDFGDSANLNSLSVPGDTYNAMLKPAYEAGARVHSNSWGTLNIIYDYNGADHDFDAFVYDYPEMVIVVAAGNCGDVQGSSFDCAASLAPADAPSILAPALSKNVMAIGASLNGGNGGDIEQVAYFSSRGPTPDGRIKPDLVAPGSPVVSARADPSSPGSCGVANRVGTSMAAPVAAGNAALVRQYFREGWYSTGGARASKVDFGFSPSAALVKALMINSAKGMSAVQEAQSVISGNALGDRLGGRRMAVSLDSPPDGIQGFGRLTLDQGINLNGTVGLFFRDEELSEGAVLQYNVSILPTADAQKDLSITLVWTDPPGGAGSTKIVLHDLDLKVYGPNGEEFFPNGLQGADRYNNVERIVVNPTIPGSEYIIEVTGTSVAATGTQRFAVVANGEFIETNEPPQVSDDESNNLLDEALNFANNIDFTWQLGVIVGASIVGCCILSCGIRTCMYSKAKYRRRNLAKARNPGSPTSPTFAPSPRAIVEACPECSEVFTDVILLVQHVQVAHEGKARRPPPAF